MEDKKFAVYQDLREIIERAIEEENFTSTDVREMKEFLDEDLAEVQIKLAEKALEKHREVMK